MVEVVVCAGSDGGGGGSDGFHGAVVVLLLLLLLLPLLPLLTLLVVLLLVVSSQLTVQRVLFASSSRGVAGDVGSIESCAKAWLAVAVVRSFAQGPVGDLVFAWGLALQISNPASRKRTLKPRAETLQ